MAPKTAEVGGKKSVMKETVLLANVVRLQVELGNCQPSQRESQHQTSTFRLGCIPRRLGYMLSELALYLPTHPSDHHRLFGTSPGVAPKV